MPLKPGERFRVTNSLPDGTTFANLALLPETDPPEFTLEPKGPSTADIKWHAHIGSSDTVAILELKDRQIFMTWGQRIDIDKSSQKILSYVIQYRDRSSPSSDSPRLYPIWQVYDIAAPLSLRHCFKGKPLYSFDNSAKQLTPTAFPFDSLYFRFLDPQIQDLYGPAHDSRDKNPVPGTAPSTQEVKTADGAAWTHRDDNQYPCRYLIQLSQLEDRYVLTGRYQYDKSKRASSLANHLARILESGDAQRLQATREVVEHVQSGYKIVSQLDAYREQPSYTKHDIDRLRDLSNNASEWCKIVSGLRPKLQTVPTRSLLQDLKTKISELNNETQGGAEALAQRTEGKADQDISRRIAHKVGEVVAKVRLLVSQLYVGGLGRDESKGGTSPTINDDVLKELKDFQSIILSRTEMFAEDSENRPQVRLELCRRVEWVERKEGKTEKRYKCVPVVRFGAEGVP